MVESNVQINPETPRPTRTHLLMHGTQGSELKQELLTEYGLAAYRPTLTPILDLAVESADVGPNRLLTFWYPQKGEVGPLGLRGGTEPVIPLTDEQRTAMKDRVEHSDISEDRKELLLRNVTMAKTMLPASRLGAVLQADNNILQGISIIIPDEDGNFLSGYESNKDEWISELTDELRKRAVIFYKEGLTAAQLASDMVQTRLEHLLIQKGQFIHGIKQGRIGIIKEDVEREIEEIQNISFSDPRYERYRKSLVAELEKQLQGRYGEISSE